MKDSIETFIEARLATDERRAQCELQFYSPPMIFTKIRLGVALPDGQSVLETTDGQYAGMVNSAYRYAFIDWDDPALRLDTLRRMRVLVADKPEAKVELARLWSSHPDFRAEWTA